MGLFPPLGWNTWCSEASCEQHHSKGKLHDVCNETEIKQVADAMISNGMFQLGYRYINLGQHLKLLDIVITLLCIFLCPCETDDCWGATKRAEV